MYPSRSTRRARARALAENSLANTEISKPLSKSELAAFLDVSVRFIEREVEAGRLHGIRLGDRSIRFFPKAVQAWLDAKETTTAEAK